MKRINRSAVLSVVHQYGQLSRTHLAEELQLTPAAITNIVSDLIEEGLLIEGKSMRSNKGAGRSQIMLEISPQARFGLGIVLNVGYALLSAVWLDGSLICSEHVDLPQDSSAGEVIAMLAGRMNRMVEANALDREKIIGLGVAVRGMVDKEKRVLIDSFGVFSERNIPIAEMFEKASGLTVVVDNNVRTLFSAQLFLERESNGSQFFLRCEYGIGGALSINGEIWSGGKGHCSEIGHIQVIRRGGKPCFCGKSGCLETVASPTAILSEAKRILSPGKTPMLAERAKRQSEIVLNDVMECAANGDPGAASIVERAVRALGQAIKSVIYIIDPQKIVLYGSLFENAHFLVKLMAELDVGLDKDHADIVIEKSAYYRVLDSVAAGILVIRHYISCGGLQND